MQIAIDAAHFTPEEANGLRRAMATFRNVGTILKFRTKMIEGMVSRGYDQDFAERCFRQIEGFGTYGFPESHAASFAVMVYVSAWLKYYHPAHFSCALLNSQPMGFYAPAQILRDAREHGIAVRAINVQSSEWLSIVKADGSLQMGFSLINGFKQEWSEVLIILRGTSGLSLDKLVSAELPKTALLMLADADALQGVGLHRRTAFWQVFGLDNAPRLPMLTKPLCSIEYPNLPLMPSAEEVLADYQANNLSIKSHPMRFLRHILKQDGVSTCAEALALSGGKKLRIAGLVLTRQRPGKGSVLFCTLEDETGSANVIVWQNLMARFRYTILTSKILEVHGILQKTSEGVRHVIASHLEDRTTLVRNLIDTDAISNRTKNVHHRAYPRSVRKSILPVSRDFR